MNRILVMLFTVVPLIMCSSAVSSNKSIVVLETTIGDITLELEDGKAPVSVNNFLSYIEKSSYNNTIFHRVINNFMIQGGGFSSDMQRINPLSSIKNESNNGLSNVRGSISMARTSDPDSATNQFFINHQNNLFLDHNNENHGYAVFGKVIQGIEVVDRIAQVKTHKFDTFEDVPIVPVIITKATLTSLK